MSNTIELSITLPNPEDLANQFWNKECSRELEEAIKIFILEHVRELKAHVPYEYKNKYNETIHKL